MFLIEGVTGGKAILAASLGGVLCLDRIFLQAMISRPVVVATAVGFALHDLPTALVMGSIIEILWADHLPIGVYIPPNDSVMAVVATGSTILAGEEIGSVSKEMIAFSILLFLPLAFLAQKLDQWIVATNSTLSDRAVRSAAEGRPEGITGSIRISLVKTLTLYTLFIFLFLLIGDVILVKVYPLLSGDVPMKALLIVFWSLPLIGIAAVLNAVRQRGVLPVFTGLFFLAVLFGTLLRS